MRSMKRDLGALRLDFRSPEDQVASGELVHERFQVPVNSERVSRAIEHWDAARLIGDAGAEASALRLLVEETAAHFRVRGVPVFARPVLPPQVVENEARLLSTLPRAARAAALQAFVGKFEPDVQPGVVYQLARKLEVHRPFSGSPGGPEIASGSRPFLLGGPLEAVDQPAQQRPAQSRAVPQPPREHPNQTQRDAARTEWCNRELSRISDMWFSRQSYATERDGLLQEIASVERGDDSSIQAQLKPLRDKLRKKKQELLLLNLPSQDAPDCKWTRDRKGKWRRVCRPGMGPIPDQAARHQQRLELEAEIKQLEEHIASLESQLKAPKLATLRRRLNEVCAKLRESSALLVPMQEQYERTCNRTLPPWPDSMKPVPGCG